MASRPRHLVALVSLVPLALVAVGLSGCTDTAAPTEPDDPPADDGDETPVSRLLGRTGGVQVENLSDPAAPGTLSGVVYDPANGSPIAAASVFATCMRIGLVPGFSEQTTTNATGHFTFPEPATLSDCSEITYEVRAAGYTLALPLVSGPIENGTATFVHGAMLAQVLAA